MKLETYSVLTSNLTIEIEEFLLRSTSKFNPLFSSPVWADRLREIIDFNYRFIIIRDGRGIVALHLVFNGYRGYTHVNKFPLYLRFILRKFLFFFYGYQTWYNFIIFKENLNFLKIEQSKNLIYKNIESHGTRVANSPIFDGDITYFHDMNIHVSKWGTYILNFHNKTYKEIQSNYKRQARRPIKQAKSKGVCIKRLQEIDLKEYTNWLLLNQKETGKNYVICEKMIKRDLSFMGRSGYTGEIFVAYLDGVILGSLGIWGFGDFISEHGVNNSSYAKKNKIYVQDLIKDEVVKYCYSNNIKYYDLSGFNPSKNASDKERAINFFKEKFGGVKIVYDHIV
jgi:hypothetical protein